MYSIATKKSSPAVLNLDINNRVHRLIAAVAVAAALEPPPVNRTNDSQPTPPSAAAVEKIDPVYRFWKLRLASLKSAIQSKMIELSESGITDPTPQDLRAISTRLFPCLNATVGTLRDLFVSPHCLSRQRLIFELSPKSTFSAAAELFVAAFRTQVPETQQYSESIVQIILDKLDGAESFTEPNDLDILVEMLKQLALSECVAFVIVIRATEKIAKNCKEMQDLAVRLSVEQGRDVGVVGPILLCYHAVPLIDSTLRLCHLVEDLIVHTYVVAPKLFAPPRLASGLEDAIGESLFRDWAAQFDEIFACGPTFFTMPSIVTITLLRISSFIVEEV